MKEKVFTLENFFFYIFLFFFIFPTNLNAETISTDITVSADTDPAGTSKTITEDLTITSSGSLTCTKISNCIHFGDSGLTIDNQGTIKINGGLDKDNVIRAANSSDDNSTVNNSGTIVNEGGNNAIFYSVTDSGYIYNTGTISVTSTKKATIQLKQNTNFKIDNYGTITNTSSNGQTIYSLANSGSDTGAIINNYAGGVISAPNNTASAEKGAFNTVTDDPSDNWTINNWGTITAAYDTMTIGTSYTINNYGTIESTNYDYPAIISVGNNNTINLYDGTLLIGYIDDGTAEGTATSGHALNLNLCSSYDFKVVGGTNYTVKDTSGCGDVVYSGGYARSASALFQSTTDELLALKVDLINETLDFINNTEENKDEQFGFVSKSYTDRENGEAIDKFAVHKKNFVLVEPRNSERFNSFSTFSLSLDDIKLSNLEVKSTNLQYGFFLTT